MAQVNAKLGELDALVASDIAEVNQLAAKHSIAHVST
jgi:hypothetical protein